LWSPSRSMPRRPRLRKGPHEEAQHARAGGR
jgi:hypothetical protein